MNNWKEYRFSDFVELNPTVKIPKDSQISFVEMKDLEDGKRFCFPSQERELSGGSRFQNYDTLFARITPCLENGKICQVKGLKNNVGFGSTEFHIFRGKNDISDSNFIFYLSRWKEVRDHAEMNFDGTSGRQRVPRQSFDDLILNLPPLPEQTAIASILSSLDDKIDLLHRQNTTLEKMAESLFRQWFVEEAKEEWEELSEFADNIKVNANVKDLLKHKNYIGLEHIPRKSISLINWGNPDGLGSNKSVFQENDILFGKLRSYFHKVIFAPVSGICSTDILVFRPKNKAWFSFCLFWFSSEEVVNYSDLGSGGTRMPRTSWEIIKSYKIPKPSIEKIENFSEKVEPMINKIKSNQTQIRTLTAMRDNLLPKLMSGEVRVEI
jgi:type I restriction enzyme S subunit